MTLNKLHCKELFFEKVIKRGITTAHGNSSTDGLLRGDLELFLYEELAITEVGQAHSILSKVTTHKLLSKESSKTSQHNQLLNKAI
jgi:hypothetical protein